QKPSISRLRGRYVAAGRSVNVPAQRCYRAVRYRDDAEDRRREAAVRTPLVEGCDHCRAALESDVDQLAKEPVVRTAEAHVDDVRPLIDREIERFDQAEAVAHSPAAARLPAGPEAEDPRSRRNACNADAVTCLGGDNSRDASPVLLDRSGPSGDEVAVDHDLAGEVRVPGLDPAVDHGDLDSAACGQLVKIGEAPLACRGLGRVERI